MHLVVRYYFVHFFKSHNMLSETLEVIPIFVLFSSFQLFVLPNEMAMRLYVIKQVGGNKSYKETFDSQQGTAIFLNTTKGNTLTC